MRSRKTLFLIITGFLIVALPLFILLAQRTQENRSHATAATTLALSVSSPNQTITVNDPIVLAMTVNPGSTNLVSVINFVISYDKTKVAPTASPFTLDSSLTGWKVVNPIKIDSTNGTITGTYSVGSDPTQAIQKVTSFGTLNFTAIAGTEGQTTTIGFSSGTAVYSLGFADTAYENVLTTTTPAQFTIASSVLPTATPTVTPSIAPTVSPTTPPTVKIQGHYVDSQGNALTLPGQSVNIYKVTASDPVGTLVTSSQASPSWSFDTLPRDSYRVEVAALPGYKITYNPCFDCTFHPDYNNQGNSATADFSLNLQSNYVDIAFMYTASPSPTPTPSPTPIAATGYLAVNIGLHGIGYAGDNANPGHQVSFSTTNPPPTDAPPVPVHTTRDASIQFYDAQNQLLYSLPTTLQFSPDTYTFGKILQFTPEALTLLGGKSVSIRISIPKYLTVIYPLITIKNSGTTNLPYTPMIAGNVYDDTTDQNQLDILDYNAIMDCRDDVDAVNKSGTCSVDADVNDDGRVDVFDYNLFIRELSTQSGR